MNVFVLCTGRCGSVTVTRACDHISNYTSGHESRTGIYGEERLDYPENHIEADNRLSWLLGRLDEKYGDNAFYVHLKRDENMTAASFVKRYRKGIMMGYQKILHRVPWNADKKAVALDYCRTVNSNIESFLKDKTKTMQMDIENGKEDFARFWDLIGAEGDKEKALAEFDVRHNASKR
jgi:hypothetical protein